MYLIIGANGQLGSELREILGDRGHYVDVEGLDITDFEAARKYVGECKPRYIVNCAAYTAVDKAEEEEARAYAINADGASHLAKAAAEHDAVLLHVSTDYVFDGNGCRPYRTSSPTAPASAYGRTKLAGEQKCLAEEKATVAVVRTAWLYSSYGNNFVKTMRRLGEEKASLNVISDQIGSPTYAADLARALVTMAPRILKGSREVYHYSNEGAASWYDFACAVMELSSLSCKVNPIPTELYPTPARRPYYSLMDKSRIREEFNLDIRHWREALRECIQRLETF